MNEPGNPNDTQIGGDHYKATEFQPWDWPLAVNCTVGLGHYETSAIQYIARFRKKGGAVDLEKAIHYIDKMRWAFGRGFYKNSCDAGNLAVCRFNSQNGCDQLQSAAIWLLVQWRSAEELDLAKTMIRDLIDREKEQNK